MNIQLISDLHGRLPDVPPCDVLVIAGDICPDFHDMSRARLGASALVGKAPDVGEQRQRHWLDTVFRAWLYDVPAERVIAIAGNHDYVMEHRFLIPADLPWSYLQDEALEVGGVKFYGLPWVPNLPSWAFFADDRKLDLVYDVVPDDTDVLISHGPPLGYLDKVTKQWPGEEAPSVGSQQALDCIERVQPRMFVCGHIHEDFGTMMRWHDEPRRNAGTVIYNVSHVDENYSDRVRHPQRVTLP